MVDRVIEELLEAQNTGLKITDYSLPEHDPDRIFKLKLILLMAVGDYPAQGKLTNFLHCGVRPCHWCNMDFNWLYQDTTQTTTIALFCRTTTG
jgi:hypothetical protein